MAIRTDGIYSNLSNKASYSKNTQASWATKQLRNQFVNTIQSLEGGHIQCVDPIGPFSNSISHSDLPLVRMEIKNLSFYKMLLKSGSLGAAQSYINHDWVVSDLTALIQLMIRNRALLDKLDGKSSWITKKLAQIWHLRTRNSEQGSKKNISAHYDLSNDFFRLFLDKHMMYSSAIYENDQENLEVASERKLNTICQKLQLTANDNLIEIGTGWGGLACYAAKEYGCKVTTTTISQEQFNYAKQKVKEEKLEHLVTVLDKDYRKLTATYDKLVSIEMVEAVGHQYLSSYFATCAKLLRPKGLALLQAITIEDHRYELSLNEIDFIKKYIFPGSFIPSTSVLVNEAGKYRLRLCELSDFGQSYAKTLNAWLKRFKEKKTQITEQGFNEEFQRLWEFYLCYCEGGFIEESISCQHLLFKKTKNN